ncbi:hypothetical protein CQ12_24025 [Bradyrhizobium jicamae]|uniref:Uncharacterized protein n=1 Tax=Bradyrhizobium jicamae TaxID=280332 RepID=A0A0R3L7K0_9BRAD|nr:hypothetical protein [Bradyrhizobium jicamae]KRR03945.1 hypothetical protein CQ12_24025 [Bradyrhizobium jicamae]
MVRIFVAATLLACFVVSASAQIPSPPGAATQADTPAVKPAAKKPAPKSKAAAKQSAPAESGPCQIGIISAIGDKFAVQKVGLTVFGNELTEVPIHAWGLDDLVVARVRAATSGVNVRKIAYSKGAFEPYYHPPTRLFRNDDEELTSVVRQIAASSNCARYFVFTTYAAQLQGTNQSLPGIGVLHHGSGPFSNTSLFANFVVRVFDGQSFAIAKRPSADLGAILAGSFGRLGQDPLTKLEAEDFPASPADAVASSTLRDHTRALLAARLDKAVAAYLKQE